MRELVSTRPATETWLRIGLIGGAASAVITAVLAVISTALATGDACHRHGPRWTGDLGFIIFLGLMVLIGYLTAHAGQTVGRASLAGLVGGLVSALGTMFGFLINLRNLQGVVACVAGNVGNANGVDLAAAGTTLGVIALIVTILVGMGIGAGAGAIGGLIGRPMRDV